MVSRPHRQGSSNPRDSTQLSSPTNKVVKSPIGKGFTTRQKKKYQKDRKLERFVKLLRLLMVTAADISELPIHKLADDLIPAQVSKAAVHADENPAIQIAFQKTATEQVLAQIYADLHVLSVLNNPKAVNADDRDLNNTLQERWIQSNIKFHTQATFKVIEYALASSELNLTNSLFANHVHKAVKSTPFQFDQLSRVLAFRNLESTQGTRYESFATEHGWMMLSILGHSPAFREAIRTVDDWSWESLNRNIRDNFDSLEYFAKIRGLDWSAPLKRLPGLLTDIRYLLKERHPHVRESHPHDFIVPEEWGRMERPHHEGYLQYNINECDYRTSNFENRQIPKAWPAGKPYPSDPTLSTKICSLCQQHDCDCHPSTSPQILRPLVELRRYGKKGTGIRTLQPFPKNAILDEYIGVLYPCTYKDDPIYSMAITDPDDPSDTSYALISSKHAGNWTRFISHSCNPNTKFKGFIIGGRERTMVVAVRKVEIFEEVTVDYGESYFSDKGLRCLCGERNCKFPASLPPSPSLPR